MTNPLLPPTAEKAGHIFVRAAVVVLLLLLVAAVWIGARGYLALGHLQKVQPLATAVANNPTDTATVSRSVGQIQDEVDAAHRLTSDPVWRLGQRVPYVGAQLAAVGETTAALNSMAADGLSPLADVVGSFSPADLMPKKGRIDTSALNDISDAAGTSATHMTAAAHDIDAIDRRGLLPPLATAIDELSVQVDQAAGAVDGIHRASVLLPKFLGEDGKRSYLVVGQNNAEWRSLGGMVGAMFTIDTAKGRIDIGDFTASTDLDRVTRPLIPLPDELLKFVLPNPAVRAQNATQVPDFAVSGEILQARWKKQFGKNVDGVIAIDPVTLSYLLEATGPVTVPTAGGQTVKITSKNAVSILLNKVYVDYPTDVQDAIYNATVAAVFTKIMDGNAEPRALLSALSKASGERRILIWSEREAEQAALDGTNLQGALPVTDKVDTRFGVFVNDGTGSKLSYYMGLETGAAWCRVSSDSADSVLQVTLRNNAPKNITSLPDSVVGPGYYQTKRGLTRNLAYFYLPKGAQIIANDVAGDGPLGGFGRGTHNGIDVLTWETLLAPGETATATVRVRTGWTPNISVVATSTLR